MIVGVLFFFQLATFMIGSSLIEQFLDGEAGRTTLAIGVAFEMFAGLAVVAIGLLMYRVLRIVNERLAIAYPIMRVIEFAISAILSIYLLARLQEFPNHLLWVYIPTGVGGVILNYVLFAHRLIPRVISSLGLIGYVLLLLVVPLDLFGAVDADRAVAGLGSHYWRRAGCTSSLSCLCGSSREGSACPCWRLPESSRSREPHRRVDSFCPAARRCGRTDSATPERGRLLVSRPERSAETRPN